MIDFTTIDALLRDATGQTFPAAQVLAVDHFSLVYERAVGDCDPETLFDIASLTKPLSTATLAMMAIEAGELALDDRPRSDVTVEELLTHSSGLPAWKLLGATREEVLRAVAAEPLESPPGAVARYSDLGFILLGATVENALGEPLDAAFARRLDAIIEFPPPAPEERRALWRSHLGTAHDVAAVALNQLAALVDLPGGNIRNVVLAAAVQARAEGRPIRFADLIAALGGEYRKVGRSVPHELRGPLNGSFAS